MWLFIKFKGFGQQILNITDLKGRFTEAFSQIAKILSEVVDIFKTVIKFIKNKNKYLNTSFSFGFKLNFIETSGYNTQNLGLSQFSLSRDTLRLKHLTVFQLNDFLFKLSV